jgi:Zn-finger nucleic acid-binding protein
MNFIGSMEGSEASVELKYCERCGGLFLRRPGDVRVHCTACTAHFARQLDAAEMRSTASVRKPRRRRKQGEATEGREFGKPGQIRCLQGVAGEEVWA